jgi:hypothetical protein
MALVTPVLGFCRSCRGQPTFGQTTVGKLCLHRPAPVLLGGVANRLLAQPALRTECRGDDLGGAPRAGQYAGWRPRSPHGFSTRRPAPPEGLAAPAAGWRLHRGELEPGDEDKVSQWLSGRKQVGPDRSDRSQGWGDARHDRPQPMRDRRPFPTTGSEAKEKGYALQMLAQGKGTL